MLMIMRKNIFATSLLTVITFCSALPAAAGYDKNYIGETIEYRAKYEDTFVHVARDHGLGFVEMRAANPGIDPWLPGAGTKLILPKRHILPDAPRKGVVINLPEMRFYSFLKPGIIESFPIAVGREGLDTPLGTTTVVRKVEGPIWRPTPRMLKEKPELEPVVMPGPDNPMGTHALYLGWPQYAIHGTDKPFGIGRRASSGCIRMYPEDIIQVYEMVPVGTQVTVVNQPIRLAWIDDRLYLEADPEIEQAISMEEMGHVESPKLTEADMMRILKAAGEWRDKLRWPAIRTAVRERRGYPVEIARRSGARAEEPKKSDEHIASVKPVSKKQAKAEAKQKAKELKADAAKQLELINAEMEAPPAMTNKNSGAKNILNP
jgi:L,D-transpeptidase ErfK/SrfK